MRRRKDKALRWLDSECFLVTEVSGVIKLILQATSRISCRLSSGCVQFLDTPFQQLSTCRAIASHTVDNSPVMIHLFNKAIVDEAQGGGIDANGTSVFSIAVANRTPRRWLVFVSMDRSMDVSLPSPCGGFLWWNHMSHITHPRNPSFIRQDSIHSTSTSHTPLPFILSTSQTYSNTGGKSQNPQIEEINIIQDHANSPAMRSIFCRLFRHSVR